MMMAMSKTARRRMGTAEMRGAESPRIISTIRKEAKAQPEHGGEDASGTRRRWRSRMMAEAQPEHGGEGAAGTRRRWRSRKVAMKA
jgi:hypothetical protein